MRILFVSQYFYPENFRINDLAKRLIKRGHEITVLTGIPNYPQGEFYDGYSLFKRRREEYEGVNIIRVPVFPRYHSKLYLALNYLSFVVFGCMKAKTMSKSDFDVIYAFGTSPITQVLPALTMKKRCNAKVIANVQDLWPDNVVAITGIKSKLVIKLLDYLVDYIYNRCDVILGTSHSFIKAIKGRRGLKEKKKVSYWPQYAVVEPTDKGRRDILPEGVFHIVFTGNVGDGQGLENVILAAAVLKKRGITDFCFDIVGDGRARKRLTAMAQEKGVLDNEVRFHGSFPEQEIPGILAAADAALLILNPSPIFEKTIPAKLQTYLVCGVPVIGCVSGEARDILKQYEAGVCVEKINPEALAGAVSEMLEMSPVKRAEFKENAFKLSKDEFDRETLIDRLEHIMLLLKEK